MTSSLIASAMMRDPLYHIECLTVPSYTKYLISSQRPTLTATGKQPTFVGREAVVMRGRPRLPPLPQQVEDLRRQHHVPVLATLRLHDADDHLLAVDVARSPPHHLAGPQPATIGEG